MHSWTLDPIEAARVQTVLRQRLVLRWDGRVVETIGGFDVNVGGNLARAAIAVLLYPSLEPLEGVTVEMPLVFPYIPGLLAFREGLGVLAVWEKLKTKPDLLMFDGQGIAHPRGIGIASQMGLWLECPTIGVAKSRLYGQHAQVGLKPAERADLFDERDPKRVIGTVLRTREKANPLYISPGHLIDPAQSEKFVLNCCRGYRLPEPTRWAHKLAVGEKLPMDQPRLV
jgi:deoxyribonuclease V